MRLFSLWKEKPKQNENRTKVKIFASVQQLYKEFDKITTFSQLRKQL